MNELARSAGIAGAVMDATNAIAQTARTDAPVGETEEYRDSIKTRLKFQERAVGIVYSDDDKALIVESKTGNLARAVKKNARRR
ncbi:hypothetical protein [Microbacterium aerolatum]|uniref:hypothetical protein n=1 Tax=Microbacterium aerolatum TaxID=153731 RepID=UPI00384FB613